MRLKKTQALLYIAGGLWPLVHMRSFEKVTGRKEDKWLVKTVGLLTASIGVVLLKAENTTDTRRLGKLSAISFGVIDFYYTAKGRIKKIYAADGIVQALLLVAWLVRRRNGSAKG